MRPAGAVVRSWEAIGCGVGCVHRGQIDMMEGGLKRFFLSLPLAAVLLGSTAVPATTIAITNVTVIPIDTENSLEGRTVVIEDGKITRIGTGQAVPAGASRIDGTGKFLMPALADMHVHLLRYLPRDRPTLPLAMEAPLELSPKQQCAARNELYLYLFNGVTTVRDMSGTPTILQWSDKVAKGQVEGPKIHATTPILDGNPPANPTGTSVNFDNAAQVPQAMKVLASTRVGDARYEFVKIYEQMQADVYDAVVTEARKYGLPVVGHVPFVIPIEKAIADGQRSIEHLRGYEVDPHNVPRSSLSIERWSSWNSVPDDRIVTLARSTAGKDIWNVPTLTVNIDGMAERWAAELAKPEIGGLISAPLGANLSGPLFPPALAPQIFSAQLSTFDKQRTMIHALRDSGAKIMTGTDANALGVIPGFALLREIELLVDYGLTPYQALRAATLEPQRFLKNREAGHIAEGARGDYLLLDADPLSDIGNIRAMNGIVVDGQWHGAAELRKKLLSTRACS